MCNSGYNIEYKIRKTRGGDMIRNNRDNEGI